MGAGPEYWPWKLTQFDDDYKIFTITQNILQTQELKVAEFTTGIMMKGSPLKSETLLIIIWVL